MLVQFALTAALLAPAAPAAPGPAGPPPPVDREKLDEFGSHVYAAAMKIQALRPDADLVALAAGAARGLYDAAARPAPEDLAAQFRGVKRHEDRMRLLGDHRARLAGVPALRSPRDFLAAVHGFRHAFDPLSGLATLRVGTTLGTDCDFGLGFELAGVEGLRLTAYRLERSLATGAFAPVGLIEPLRPPPGIPSPALLPWRVSRVVPGSPAHRGGVKPGDIVTHLDGAAVTAADADRLIAKLMFPPGGGYDPRSGIYRSVTFGLGVRRGAATHAISLTTEDYAPESVSGVVRKNDGTWDGMLDPEHRIGYVRVGWVDFGTPAAAAAVVGDLTGRGCRGLVLDLRWCPGGYVAEGTEIAGLFLPPGSDVARVDLLPGVASRPASQYKTLFQAKATGPRFPTVPLVVLVGGETTGGGELIAAALQTHGRAAVVGQRTVGRAATQEVLSVGYADLGFKATYGTSLRPDGRPRHRTPASSPTDDWGVRPDNGLEVPTTPAVAAQLRAWAEEHSLRVPDDRLVLPFDDPDRDPVRATALTYLRKKLGRPAPPPVEN